MRKTLTFSEIAKIVVVVVIILLFLILLISPPPPPPLQCLTVIYRSVPVDTSDVKSGFFLCVFFFLRTDHAAPPPNFCSPNSSPLPPSTLLPFKWTFCNAHSFSSSSYRLVGLVVKASASRAEDPGIESRWRRDFSGSSHTSDLNIGTPVATLPGAWHYRVSAGTGRPGVSIL